MRRMLDGMQRSVSQLNKAKDCHSPQLLDMAQKEFDECKAAYKAAKPPEVQATMAEQHLKTTTAKWENRQGRQ